MMEKEHIQQLLERYMAAETTEEEEQLLFDYFCTHHDIPAEWRNYSVLFRGIRQYDPKPNATSMKAILKWSAAAAIMVFVFVTGAKLMHQEETNKPSDAVAEIIIEEPVTNDEDDEQVTIMKEAPVAIVKKQTRLAKPTRSVRKDKSAINLQKAKDVKHIDKMLNDADMAFSLATVQCSMNIEESFLQEEVIEKTDDETNIFL